LPRTATAEIVGRAFEGGYGVPAINVVNDLTLEAVLAAAEELRSPLIVQTSVKTVRSVGIHVLFSMWQAMTRDTTVPVALHLDHCPEREVISACLEAGWDSVLFDAHELSVEENQRQCIEIVAEARRMGAAVEGEIEGIRGVEDGIGSDDGSVIQSQEIAVQYIRSTGVDIFAPAIGNAHGKYAKPPVLDAQRVTDLVAATGVPMALHGGTGMTAEQFSDLIGRGCAKVNVSTALKIAFMEANRRYLTENSEAADPPMLLAYVREAVMEMTRQHIRMFGSAGQA
jgi:fructose-bisphosphate aldolase, class II